MAALVLPATPQSRLWLDGPIGTQLEAQRFVPHPKLWTALALESAPMLLAAVHRSYLKAGAQCVTANTFRTTAHAAAEAGVPLAQMRRCAERSVSLARQVAEEFSAPRYVLGSLAPLADCYHPEQTPTDAVVEREHARTADWLLSAGCDGLLLETQGCGREVRLALAAIRRSYTGAVLVSLLPDETGTQLFDGSDLYTTARACADLGATALLVNCVHVEVILRALDALRRVQAEQASALWLGAYPNAAYLQRSATHLQFRPDPDRSSRIVERGQQLVQAGAQILGLCCGFGPADLAALITALPSPPAASDL